MLFSVEPNKHIGDWLNCVVFSFTGRSLFETKRLPIVTNGVSPVASICTFNIYVHIYIYIYLGIYININNETITNSSNIAYAFNSYFAKVAIDIQSSIRLSKQKNFDYLPPLSIKSFHGIS